VNDAIAQSIASSHSRSVRALRVIDGLAIVTAHVERDRPWW
jgi:hypothetical protein